MRNLSAFQPYQVFLNYPFDSDFEAFGRALHFAVVAAGLVPVCAKDLTLPDRPRLETLVEAIISCPFSVHDLSRGTGEGEENLARLNMPIEMGMALFHALQNQRREHRCAFFVTELHQYQAFASDLAGLDPKCYVDAESLLAELYEWLRDSLRNPLVNRLPAVDVIESFRQFQIRLSNLKPSRNHGHPTHDESQEVMFALCAECGWWPIRQQPLGRIEFPILPLAWKEQ